MIKSKTLKTLEYDKILAEIAKLTVLNETKHLLLNYNPETDFFAVKLLLQKTEEAKILLYNYGVKSIEYFDEIVDEFERAKKASVLSMKELLNIAKLLRSSRIASTSILDLNLDETINLNAIANRIFYDFNLENSIFSKIVNDTTIADNASEKLFEIRKTIRIINEKIREKLSIYIKSGANKYLQDNIISVRSGRYVVPVKSEHVKSVKGFIHDRSITGNTFFIEPQEILELNNELKTATLNESAEIERILTDLTKSVSIIVDKLEENLVYLCDLDLNFAKAEYAYSIKAIKPKLNANGYISIINGRHPLINKDKVVPISLTFGKDYNYILISGPNTGGKTVTLKLVGLFTLLTLSGIFIPASEGTEISVFQDVFVDVGDEQSIEQNLSTFSSHLKNIIEIVENVSGNSLVLIDELGAGTDPDEGSALAKAILEELINKNSFGIVTTHYFMLKEFALNSNKIINASMDFDSNTYAPLYKVRLGAPGLSNAIEIASRLGLSDNLILNAKSNLSKEKQNFIKILEQAEKVRAEAEKSKLEIDNLKEKQIALYTELKDEKEKFEIKKQKFMLKANVEARKLVNEKLSTAEELLDQMKEIFNKEEYYKSDLVLMSTLKNKLESEKYNLDSTEKTVNLYEKADISKLKIGDKVFVTKLNSEGEIIEINKSKNTVWALVGLARINLSINDISFISSNKNTKNAVVTMKRASEVTAIQTEINVIGLSSDEALNEVSLFLDKAIRANLEEIRIVHGKGLKILSTAIHKYLKEQKTVESFRFGKYGEGEHGVTIVKLK